MASVNKVILIGNLGADPEIRTLENGSKVARLRLATTETYTNREGQRVENVEWHTVNFWRQTAEIVEKYLTKGKQIYVEGRLHTRQYKDKDGIDRYTTEIEGNIMQMLGKASEGGDSPARQSTGSTATAMASTEQNSSNDPTDDLPF